MSGRMEHLMDDQVELLTETCKILTRIYKLLDVIKYNTSSDNVQFVDTDSIVHKLQDVMHLIKKTTEKPKVPIMAEYVWIHPDNNNFCSKIKTIAASINKDADKDDINLPNETIEIYSGEEQKDYYVRPVAKFNDPFQRENHVLVFCETFYVVDYDDTPTISTRNRSRCEDLNQKFYPDSYAGSFEIEQEFYFNEFNNRKDKLPLSIEHNSLGRKILETHYRACLSANIPIISATFVDKKNGINYYSYRIGPADILKVSDCLWLSRYILQRISEESNVTVQFGCRDNNLHHFYPSTHYYYKLSDLESTAGRANDYIKNMGFKHHSDIQFYDSEEGSKTKEILLKKMKTSEFTERCVKIINGARNLLVIRDSRPAGDSDPYIVTSTIITTCRVEDLKRR